MLDGTQNGLSASGLAQAYLEHIRRTEATLIYQRTGNLRAVQLLSAIKRLRAPCDTWELEVDDALAIVRSKRGGRA